METAAQGYLAGGAYSPQTTVSIRKVSNGYVANIYTATPASTVLGAYQPSEVIFKTRDELISWLQEKL